MKHSRVGKNEKINSILIFNSTNCCEDMDEMHILRETPMKAGEVFKGHLEGTPLEWA